MHRLVPNSRSWVPLALATLAACVPPGNSTPSDSGAPSASAAAKPRPSPYVLTAPFEDDFERAPAQPESAPPAAADAGGGAAKELEAGARPDAAAPVAVAVDGGGNSELGPNWRTSSPGAWRIENGRLCGRNARNHPVWLTRAIR